MPFLISPSMRSNRWSFAIIYSWGIWFEVSCLSSSCLLSHLSPFMPSFFGGSSLGVSSLTNSSVILHETSKLERITFPDFWGFVSSKATWTDYSTTYAILLKNLYALLDDGTQEKFLLQFFASNFPSLPLP